MAGGLERGYLFWYMHAYNTFNGHYYSLGYSLAMINTSDASIDSWAEALSIDTLFG